MKKFLLSSLVILVLLVAVIVIWPFSSKAEISQATRTYLHNQALNDWLVMALAASGETNIDFGYLTSANPQSATDYARTILAITAGNQNPATTGGRDWVSGLRGFFQNNQFGNATQLNDDVWSVLALRSAGVEAADVQVVGGKNVILANQNMDGGWSYQAGLSSDTNDTAASLMALAVTGATVTDTQVASALQYLRNVQNTDGGFGYQASSTSDGASTAWVMAALKAFNQDQVGFAQGTSTPLNFLQSLALPDGSYKWRLADTEGSMIVTAYATVVLSDKTFPIRILTTPPPPPNASSTPQVNLRIEGPTQNICNTTVNATSVLAALIAGAQTCNYTPTITPTAFGRYVSAIDGIAASGTNGWLYRLNWQDSNLGAEQQAVQNNDQVLWFYGQYTDQPTRVTLNHQQANVGDTVVATVESFFNNSWQAATSATVWFGSNQVVAVNGQASWQVSGSGQIIIRATGSGLVRSESQTLTIGSTGGGNGQSSQTVNLQVDLTQGQGGGSVAFSVSQTDLGFGALAPGQGQTREVTIRNLGARPIRLTAQVSGDQFFSNQLRLNNQIVGLWSYDLSSDSSLTSTINLMVPSYSLERGHKAGQLIFWAQGL